MIVGITGHRPPKCGDYTGENCLALSVKHTIRCKLHELQPERVLTGFALGVDQWTAEACLDLDIPFTAAVPFQGQARRWPLEAQRHYCELLGQADEVVYVSAPGYARWKMDARNHWVVKHCGLLIAVWNGNSGGTANTVLYANQVGREVHVINPRELEKPVRDDRCPDTMNLSKS